MKIKNIIICLGLFVTSAAFSNQTVPSTPMFTEADMFTDAEAEELARAFNTGDCNQLSEETVRKLELFNQTFAPILPELNALAEELEALKADLQN